MIRISRRSIARNLAAVVPNERKRNFLSADSFVSSSESLPGEKKKMSFVEAQPKKRLL
jgi:hypothetical protein